jgi:hypothetical protein
MSKYCEGVIIQSDRPLLTGGFSTLRDSREISHPEINEKVGNF